MSWLEKLLPKVEKCGKGYDSCNVCPYTSDCPIFDKITLISDCLAALEGKVGKKLRKEDVLNLIWKFALPESPRPEARDVVNEHNFDNLAAAICEAQEG